LKIKKIQKYQNCGNQNCFFSIFFENEITKKEILALAQNDSLILSEDFPEPFFKIISNEYIIRGTIGLSRINVEFYSYQKDVCEILQNNLIEKITKN